MEEKGKIRFTFAALEVRKIEMQMPPECAKNSRNRHCGDRGCNLEIPTSSD
jgi:hypothetical protein